MHIIKQLSYFNLVIIILCAGCARIVDLQKSKSNEATEVHYKLNSIDSLSIINSYFSGHSWLKLIEESEEITEGSKIIKRNRKILENSNKVDSGKIKIDKTNHEEIVKDSTVTKKNSYIDKKVKTFSYWQIICGIIAAAFFIFILYKKGVF